jgi:hypothetical protein
MPLVDKLIATYRVKGNGQKICTDVQRPPRREQKLSQRVPTIPVDLSRSSTQQSWGQNPEIIDLDLIYRCHPIDNAFRHQWGSFPVTGGLTRCVVVL